jgi:hypothetical protein
VPSYLCVTHGIQPKRPCPECRREKDRRRKRTPKRRATMGVGPEGARYKRQRVAYLKTHTRCESPDGCSAPATEVHHKPGVQPGDPQWLDESTWTPVCHRCHAILEAKLMLRGPGGVWIGKQ